MNKKFRYVQRPISKLNKKRNRIRADDDDYYEDDTLTLPSMDVLITEYEEEEYYEETGILGADGNPILRHFVRPSTQRAGFIILADDDDE